MKKELNSRIKWPYHIKISEQSHKIISKARMRRAFIKLFKRRNLMTYLNCVCHPFRFSYALKIFLVLVCATCLTIPLWDYHFENPPDDLNCFYQSGNVLAELEPNEAGFGSSIFFHETSCQKDWYDIPLKPRQACSVESALIAHPNKNVFLLVCSPVRMPLADTQNRLIKELLFYQNFKVRHISFSRYLIGTPMAVIAESGALDSSLWPVSHASDILRYATLYKFGGIYLDLDVLVLKSLENLINFAGAESIEDIGSGILGFGSDRVGREVAVDCAEELSKTFNGEIWGFNGPGVITRVLKRRCNTSSVMNMTKGACKGFNVHPKDSFTAISFRDVEQIFTEDKNQSVTKMLNGSYTIHFWNKMSSSFSLDKKADIPFLIYAKMSCPRIFKSVNGSF